jgi:hypothetical protein
MLENYPVLWREVEEVISGINDEQLIGQFPLSKNKMSLSSSINDLIKRGLVERGWSSESAIFQDPEYDGAESKRWRLDFAKKDVSVEIAFNHGEATAWNLIKPVLASELNHVKKAIQTRIGVIVLATEDLKEKGGFDSAVGTYEKAIRYLKPLNNLLTTPIVLIGLLAPEKFKVVKRKSDGRNYGTIVKW